MARVVGIAVKTQKRAPLEPTDEVNVTEDGIEGNIPESVQRRITLISREQWEQVQREIPTDLPWLTRRANILVEGIILSETIGKSLRIGEITLKIQGETEPCGLMDTYCSGLMAALTPEMRAGVYGSVEKGGKIRLNDTISVEIESK